MRKDARIFVAGHQGMVGSAITRRLEQDGYSHIILRNPDRLDLTRQAEVDAFFATEKPEFVFLAAAKVGTTRENLEQPAEFLYTNAMIGLNVVRASYVHGVRKLINLADMAVYPAETTGPLPETALMTGPLDPDTEAYAVGKLTTLKFCHHCNEQYGTDFLTLVAPTVFGPGDQFAIAGRHLIPTLIRRMHEAKVHKLPQVTLWGAAAPRQSFLYVDDLADAVLFFANHCHVRDIGPLINVGTNHDVSVWELADLVREVVGYRGRVVFETGRPDAATSRLMDFSKLHRLEWRAPTPLRQGLEKTYTWFLANGAE